MIKRQEYDKDYATKVLKKSSKYLTKEDKKLNFRISKSTNPEKLKKLESKKIDVELEVSDLNKKLEGISNGTLKAGKDYAVARSSITIPVAYIWLTGPKVKMISFDNEKVIFK